MPNIRRSLLLTAVPLAAGLSCAVPAIAAGAKVSFRVEGTAKTLLAAKTFTAPTRGSITKGGTPAGACPAESAAGAFNLATHGDWDGTYSSGLGIEVTSILGTTAQYAKGSYWEFFVDGHAASTGICDTKLSAGAQYLFAQVPAKGKAELPLQASAPTKVSVGQPFTLRDFDYPGKSNATRGVSGAHYSAIGAGHVSFAASMSSAAGAERVSASKPGTLRIVVSKPGYVRSAAVTVTVTR